MNSCMKDNTRKTTQSQTPRNPSHILIQSSHPITPHKVTNTINNLTLKLLEHDDYSVIDLVWLG